MQMSDNTNCLRTLEDIIKRADKLLVRPFPNSSMVSELIASRAEIIHLRNEIAFIKGMAIGGQVLDEPETAGPGQQFCGGCGVLTSSDLAVDGLCQRCRS
jgi:hypothetical protein